VLRRPFSALILLACLPAAAADELAVVSTLPAARSLAAPPDTAVSVRFDRPLAPASIVPRRSFWAFGRWSGPAGGELELDPDGLTVTLRPARPFFHGESVLVVLSHGLEGMDGSRLRPGGYSFQFWTRTEPSSRQFVRTGRIELRDTPEQTTRAYGGVASDLNRDGWPDLAIVNEDSADLRVFLGTGGTSAGFGPMLGPPTPLGGRASPSEPADFDADGILDIAVANYSSDSVSVLLGRGDGTFVALQPLAVGDRPHGLAVLDVDGDGDIDIVTANSFSEDLSLLINDGSGNFADAVSFDSGGAGEWALAAGDMNGDGILDLVTGTRLSHQIVVLLGRGDGTFQPREPVAAGGRIWQLVLGDVDADGDEDVAAVNHSAARAALFLNDGEGNLAAPIEHEIASNPLATDLGDLDGDGDLDWVTSSIAGEWALFVNDGGGSFQRAELFPAEMAASCAILADLDRDGDLDMALIDEIGDLVLVMQNDGYRATLAPALPARAAAAALVLAAALLFLSRAAAAKRPRGRGAPGTPRR
jgi:hypothetical protein